MNTRSMNKQPINKDEISFLSNNISKTPDSSTFSFADKQTANSVFNFHGSLPNYTPTPLVKLSSLAEYLGIKNILIKDESKRFDLNAFKVLGASYAISLYLADFLGLDEEDITFDKIIDQQAKYQHITFVTATDGNHGRAVAWSAKLFGCKAVVYMPKGSSPTRLEAIKKYGAEASITDHIYDDTVNYANQQAQKQGWILIQDTAWQGYEKIPLQIMQGYFTLVTEYLLQEKNVWPTHVFVQAGVGSLPAAILAHLCNLSDRPMPKFIVVEAQGAPCLYESKRMNELTRVEGDLLTIMAGLACGKPSLIAWDILKSAACAFIACSDDIARKGMRVLGNPLAGDHSVTSGESGSVTLGALFEILSNKDFSAIKEELNLSSDSSVMLFSTEGDTDPKVYRDIVWS
jgi:diaminopropionate ammonia-lyase